MEVKRETAPVAQMIPVIAAAIEKGKPVEMTVTGSSMLPLLIDRKSSVRLTQPNDLKVGDIVLFRKDGVHYIVHRIIAVHHGLYDIVGDNQHEPDRDIPPEDIIAKVISYNRKGKHWRTSDALYRVLLPAVRTANYCVYRFKRKLSSIIRKSQR